ncbi:MAG: cobalt ECF transporter T component CbiQ [Desulfobacterales bacterium]
MANIGSAFFDLGYMDTLANQESPIHRLDPRAKLITTLIFIVAVVSFGKYEVSALIPFFIFPLVLLLRGNLPLWYLLKKLLLVAPFAILIGMFNPFLDPQPLLLLGTVPVSGGWISFLSILLRFALTVGVALVLIATTGFNGVCMALEKMGVPNIFAVQLLFLYRYIFVLIDEALRMVHARSLRTFNKKGMGIHVYGYLVGSLLFRTMDRAQRIHLAMLSRGFDGEIRLRRPPNFGGKDVRFVLGWATLFVLLRCYNLPQRLGMLMTGMYS